jgi:hypothetical protein
MATQGKIFVVVEGGIVQDVLTTSQADMELIVIDHDTEGMEDDEMDEYKRNIAVLEEIDKTGEVISLMHG